MLSIVLCCNAQVVSQSMMDHGLCVAYLSMLQLKEAFLMLEKMVERSGHNYKKSLVS